MAYIYLWGYVTFWFGFGWGFRRLPLEAKIITIAGLALQISAMLMGYKIDA